MSWDYRIVQTQETSGEQFFAAYEVYYDDQGRPISRTLKPSFPSGETLEELSEDFEYYRRALDKPVLADEDFTHDWQIDPDDLEDAKDLDLDDF